MFEQLKEITNCTFIPFLIDTNRYIDKISLSQSILFTPCTQAYIEKLGHMTLRNKTDQTGGFDKLLLKSRLAPCYSRITRIGDMSAAILTRKIPRSDFRVSFIFIIMNEFYKIFQIDLNALYNSITEAEMEQIEQHKCIE